MRVLPNGQHRIRHFGLFAHGSRAIVWNRLRFSLPKLEFMM
jgi:hypothetical protein